MKIETFLLPIEENNKFSFEYIVSFMYRNHNNKISIKLAVSLASCNHKQSS